MSGSDKKLLDDSPTPSPQLTDPWSSKIQSYMDKIKKESKDLQIQHEKACHYFRKMEIRWGIPAIIVPLICSPVVLSLNYIWAESCDGYSPGQFVSAFGLLLSSVASGINGFFKFGSRSSIHNMFSSKYSDIITDIDSEMIKKKQFRISADVFVAIIKMKFDSLVASQPIIPMFLQ